jgi:hypothetical protein
MSELITQFRAARSASEEARASGAIASKLFNELKSESSPRPSPTQTLIVSENLFDIVASKLRTRLHHLLTGAKLVDPDAAPSAASSEPAPVDSSFDTLLAASGMLRLTRTACVAYDAAQAQALSSGVIAQACSFLGREAVSGLGGSSESNCESGLPDVGSGFLAALDGLRKMAWQAISNSVADNRATQAQAWPLLVEPQQIFGSPSVSAALAALQGAADDRDCAAIAAGCLYTCTCQDDAASIQRLDELCSSTSLFAALLRATVVGRPGADRLFPASSSGGGASSASAVAEMPTEPTEDNLLEWMHLLGRLIVTREKCEVALQSACSGLVLRDMLAAAASDAASSTAEAAPVRVSAELIIFLRLVETALAVTTEEEAEFVPSAAQSIAAIVPSIAAQAAAEVNSMKQNKDVQSNGFAQEAAFSAIGALADALNVCAGASRGFTAPLLRCIKPCLDLLHAATPPGSGSARGQKSQGPMGLRTAICRLLAALTHVLPEEASAEMLATGGVLLALNQCRIDDRNPMLREWALMITRNLCSASEAVQEEIRRLKASAVVDAPELEAMGVKTRLTEDGKIKVAKPT